MNKVPFTSNTTALFTWLLSIDTQLLYSNSGMNINLRVPDWIKFSSKIRSIVTSHLFYSNFCYTDHIKPICTGYTYPNQVRSNFRWNINIWIIYIYYSVWYLDYKVTTYKKYWRKRHKIKFTFIIKSFRLSFA